MQNRLQRILARLPTYATYIRERPRWIFVLLFGRLLIARSLERALRARKPVKITPVTHSNFSTETPEEILSGLDRDGVHRGFQLAPELTEEIRNFAETTPCVSRISPQVEFLPADFREMNKGRESDIIAAYYFERVNECPAVLAIERDPLLLAVAERFIGTPPVHIRTRLWWSFPSSNATDADLHASAQGKYHFDLNDFSTLKFFFYLTDVDEGAGPHWYVEQSHRRRALRHQLTLTVGHDEKDLRSVYDDSAFKTVVGPAGTGFTENPFIFHTGTPCATTPRLMLEIEYGPYSMSEGYRYGLLG